MKAQTLAVLLGLVLLTLPSVAQTQSPPPPQNLQVMANAAALAPKIILGLPTPVETPAISGLPAAPPVQPSANLGLSKPPTANIGVGAAGTSGAVHSGFSPARSRLTGLSMLPVSPSRARLGGSFVPANHAQATAFRVHSSGVVMRHGPRR